MRAFAILAAALGLLAAPAAVAKDFQPGDLRLCNARRCVPILNRHAIKSLAGFYYVAPQPERAPAVRLGAPYYQLRFSNGYVTGIAATSRLDRFLSYGVHLGRFRRGAWYRLPDVAARELRRLAVGLTPLRVTQAALDRSR